MMNKFELLPYSDYVIEPSILNQLDTNPLAEYARRVYDIKTLQSIGESALSEKLFQNEDYVIPPEMDGRYLVKAKIGKLYLEFCPGGKESFSLNIKEIDSENRTVRSFLNLASPRYSEIHFEDILPISLSSFYSFASRIGGLSPKLTSNEGAAIAVYKKHAFQLKNILTRFLLGQEVTAEHRQVFSEHYACLYLSVFEPPNERIHPAGEEVISSFEVTGSLLEENTNLDQSSREVLSYPIEDQVAPQYDNASQESASLFPEETRSLQESNAAQPSRRPLTYRVVGPIGNIESLNASAQFEEAQSRDVHYFGTHLDEKPQNLFEVSAKLAAKTLCNLSISSEEITEILSEYLLYSNQDKTFFDDSKLHETILEELLDEKRYPLKSLLEDMKELLEEAIKKILQVPVKEISGTSPLRSQTANQRFFSLQGSTENSSVETTFIRRLPPA